MKSIRLFRWILVITNLLLIIIPIGSLVLSYFFLLPSVLTDEFNNEAKALSAAFAMWAAILVLTSVCFLGIAFTNSICLHLVAALLLCCPLALGVWIIVEQFLYKPNPNWPVVAITFTASLIWTVQVLTELLLSCALCCQPSETTSTADDDDAEAAKGLTTAEEGQEDDDETDDTSSSAEKKKKKKEKEKERKKKEKELKKKEKKESKKGSEKGSSGEKEKLVNSSSKNSDVGSSPQSVQPSAPSGTTTSGAFVPSAQAPPIEEVDEGEDEEEEDEEEEQDSQAGLGQRPLSSNIRTSPGYTSGTSNIGYRSAFGQHTSSFTTQQNNLSGDNSRISNAVNSDSVLLRPLSEDRQRLVQQMPGHYHGAITALGSGPGAVPPLATPEDTGKHQLRE